MATLSAYTKLDRVGRGSYGEVFKVRRHSDGAELVLKQVSMLGISEQEEREILNETSCMMQLSHPHIIAFVGSFLEQGSLHIVMEFASGGDLQCLIRRHTQTGTFLSEDRLWKFLIQLTQGLQHAHSRRILHRDIKASNVFIDANDNIKIGDLGLGKILGEARCALSQVGTPIYMSPEMCEGKPYDTKSDVWALGCLMFELAALKPPFQAPNQAVLARKIINEAPSAHVPPHYSREIPFIINKLLDKDPRKRPSPDSILNYSAVQIRLERARFQTREAELLAELDEAKRHHARSTIEHASALQCAMQQQQQQRGHDSLHNELLAERAKLQEAIMQEEEREKAREKEYGEWKKQEAALLKKCGFLESEVERERKEKETALQQLQKYESKHKGVVPSDLQTEHTEEASCDDNAEGVVALTADANFKSSREMAVSCTGERVHLKEQERDAERSHSRLDREVVPMPTPNHLFMSPKGPSSRANTPAALTPSRAIPTSVETSAERVVAPGIASGIRRTLLTRRSWGEGDLRSARHDINGATPPPIATPLRGPLRASADGVTPGRSSRSAGRRESGHERGVHSGGHQLKVVEGECSNRTTSEKARVDGVGERSSHAAAESLRADTEGHALAACSPDEAHHSTPTRFSSALCPKSDSCSTPCEGTRHAEQQDGDAGADKQGADSTPAFHTPSASMVTGYIRARQRTPQTSLGPAKRVPLAERLPTTGHDPESAERVIAKSKGGVTGESGSVPQPRFSGTSPKNLKGKGLSARKERGLEDDNVATAVADVWALTEGLRRSAQIALNASSSSGSTDDSPQPRPASTASPSFLGERDAASADEVANMQFPARRLDFLPRAPRSS